MMIAAGRSLFAAQGYQATTQKQIASNAGVSTSVLFRNFGSKSQLLVEAVIEPFGEFAGDLGAVYGTSGDVADRRLATEFVIDLVARLRPHRDTLRSLLTSLHTPDGDSLMGEMGARTDLLVTELVSVMAPGDSGLELDIRLVVGMVTTMVVLDDWILPAGTSVGDERVVDMLASMVSFTPDRPRSPGVRPAQPTAVEEAPQSGDPVPRSAEHQRRNSDEVRAALLASASRLFAEHGYSGTGYKEIALAAGTSESVLYRHFGSKSNLLAEAVLQPFTDSFEAASRSWALIDPGTRRIRQPRVIAELYSMFVTNRHLVRVLMGLAHDPKHDDLNGLTTHWFAQTFATLGGLSRDRARAEQVTPYEPELRIRAVVAMVMAAATLDDWFLLRNGTVLTGAPVVAAISALIDRGRRNPRES
jgi:AcrR family transcriptional regulator